MLMRPKTMWTVVVLVCGLGGAAGKAWCTEDADCAHLSGELRCIRSACAVGVCGCPRGYAAKQLGSARPFGCVKIKRVHEHCSNDGDAGSCGAAGSYCDEKTHSCVCHAGLVPLAGGERCGPPNQVYMGETCGAGLGTCGDDSVCSSSQPSSHWHWPTVQGPPTCAVSNDKAMDVFSWYANPLTHDFSRFPGGIAPDIFTRAIGEKCWKEGDCPSNAVCDSTSKLCACKEAHHVMDYLGQECNKPLGIDEKCVDLSAKPDLNYHCDGSAGLVCGDSCAEESGNHPDSPDAVCDCGPFHIRSGTTCTPRTEGSKCHGDFNCKLVPTGVCEDSTCTKQRASSGDMAPASLLSLLLPASLLLARA